MSAGMDNLVLMSESAKKQVADVANRSGGGVDSAQKDGAPKKWKTGELEFEAWMRMLDNLV